MRAFVGRGSSLAVVLGLSSLGCRAVVGIESRSEAADAAVLGDVTLDSDAPVADASCDAPTDSETGCAPCDAGIEAETGLSSCHTLQSRQLYDEPDSSVPKLGPALSGPRMGRLDDTWGLVWVGEEHESVLQLAIKDNGDDLRFPPLVPASNGAVFYDPILAAGDDRMILGVSAKLASGIHTIDYYTYDPSTGTVLDGPLVYSAAFAETPLVLSGIASAPHQNRFLAVSREAASAGVAGPVSVQLFQTAPLALLGEWALFNGQLPTVAYHAAVAWSEAAQRFGVVHLDTQPITRGWLTIFDMHFVEGTHKLTDGLLWPIADGSPFELSVTTMGDDFVVAWLDRHEAPTSSPENSLDVYVVAFNPATGITSPQGGLKVSNAKAARQYVKVVNDGDGALVAWLEKDLLDYSIRAQRLDADLKPRGGLLEIGAERDEAYQGPFGAAVAGDRDYGFATIANGSWLHFNRIACIDP